MLNIQWLSLLISIVIATISIGSGVYQSSQTRNMALGAEKVRADLTAIKIEIIDKIDQRLVDFLRKQSFQDYSEAHTKEHARLDHEQTRIRDWRHDTDALLRNNQARLDDLTAELKRVRDWRDGIEMRNSDK